VPGDFADFGGVITAIQLTGNYEMEDFHYSGVSPGDPVSAVDKAFGPKFSEFPVEEISGTLHKYDPFPFSIELVNGVVHSIRAGGMYEKPLAIRCKCDAPERPQSGPER
jgi:hypothetical protein